MKDYHHVDSNILSTAIVLHKFSKCMNFENFWKIHKSKFFFYSPFLKYILLSYNSHNCTVARASATHSMPTPNYGLRHVPLVLRPPSFFLEYTERYLYSTCHHHFVSPFPGVSYSPAASWCFCCPQHVGQYLWLASYPSYTTPTTSLQCKSEGLFLLYILFLFVIPNSQQLASIQLPGSVSSVYNIFSWIYGLHYTIFRLLWLSLIQ